MARGGWVDKSEQGMKNRTVVAYMGTVLLMLSAGYAYAIDQKPGDWEYGFYAGWYMPDPNALDSAATGGVRMGYRATENIALTGSLGYTSLEGDKGAGASTAKFKVDFTVFDFDVWYIFWPDRRLSLMLGAGPGWAYADGSATNNAGNAIDDGHVTDNTLTGNVAFGPLFRLNDRVDLRLMTRLRYYDHRSNDDLDKEITLGIVFPLQF
jgi:Outer membrane protein beta-barrel domain